MSDNPPLPGGISVDVEGIDKHIVTSVPEWLRDTSGLPPEPHNQYWFIGIAHPPGKPSRADVADVTDEFTAAELSAMDLTGARLCVDHDVTRHSGRVVNGSYNTADGSKLIVGCFDMRREAGVHAAFNTRRGKTPELSLGHMFREAMTDPATLGFTSVKSPFEVSTVTEGRRAHTDADGRTTRCRVLYMCPGTKLRHDLMARLTGAAGRGPRARCVVTASAGQAGSQAGAQAGAPPASQAQPPASLDTPNLASLSQEEAARLAMTHAEQHVKAAEEAAALRARLAQYEQKEKEEEARAKEELVRKNEEAMAFVSEIVPEEQAKAQAASMARLISACPANMINDLKSVMTMVQTAGAAAREGVKMAAEERENRKRTRDQYSAEIGALRTEKHSDTYSALMARLAATTNNPMLRTAGSASYGAPTGAESPASGMTATTSSSSSRFMQPDPHAAKPAEPAANLPVPPHGSAMRGVAEHNMSAYSTMVASGGTDADVMFAEKMMQHMNSAGFNAHNTFASDWRSSMIEPPPKRPRY